MNNKINYKKGKRREIILLLHYCGSIPYTAINHLEGSKTSRMYHAIINRMEKEGIVKIIKKNGERQLVLNNYEEMKAAYTEFIPSIYEEHYLNIALNARRTALYNDKNDAQKVLRTNEMILLMYSCGINVLPMDKVNLVQCDEIPADENMFYSSREIKNATYDLEYHKKLAGSRMDGVLFCNKDLFVVYNMRNQKYLWKPHGEYKVRRHIENVLSKRYYMYWESSGVQCERALLFANKLEYFANLLLENKKNKSFKNLLRSSFLYENIFVLPSDSNGKKMIKLMMRDNWKYEMLNDLLPGEGLVEKMLTTVKCDYYDQERQVYRLLFCIPDIIKFNSFVMRADVENKPERFEIFCFSYQVPFVRAVAKDKVKIKQMELGEYYDYIMSKRK